MPEKAAILCSDLHMSHSPPLARSGEPDWYEAMARPLRELCDLADDSLGLPVLCGGDVFEKWNCPPKLITFVMRELPDNFNSVMGQHDLPYHSWEQRESSAFWTLVESGAIDLISGWRSDGRTALRGFRWGEELESCRREPDRDEDVAIAIAHQYVWRRGAVDPVVARKENSFVQTAKKLQGFDVALFGDNHKGFLEERSCCTIFNAGTLMRRHTGEEGYKPMVGVLFDDGSIVPHYLDTSCDVFDSSEVTSEAEQVILNFGPVLDELQKTGKVGLDFRRAVEIAMEHEQVSRAVRRVILEAMEKGQSCRCS